MVACFSSYRRVRKNGVKALLSLLAVTLSVGTLRSQSSTAAPEVGRAQESAAPIIRVQTNRVLVPVVVLDKAGNPVTGLAKDDFEVVDEGKRHAISALTVLEDKAAVAGDAAGAKMAAEGSTSAEQKAPVRQKPQRFVVFLIDDLHLNMRDLSYVQKAASVLSSSLDTDDYAGLISMSGKASVHLTRDRGKLIDGIHGVQTRPVFQQTGSECPNISYYQAVQLDHDRMTDSPSFQAAMASAADCSPGLLPPQLEQIVKQATQKALNAGRQDALTSYSVILSAVQALSMLPGERHLILVSPGFEAMEPQAFVVESQVLDVALEANIQISALDARGLYVGNIGADEGGSLTGTINAVQQDLRLSSLSNATSTMASLAYETGGSFFHNNNDMQKGFHDLTRAPAMEYLLELSPEGLKADGKYHALIVKVKRKGVSVIARRGYVVRKVDEGKK